MVGNPLVRWWRNPHPFWSSLNQKVAGAHRSVTEIGERRRAQLSAWIGLLLAFLLSVATVTSIIARGEFDINVVILLVLSASSLVAYGLSRTRYYYWGGWIITGSTVVVGYVFLLVGNEVSATSLDSFIPLAFVLGSILLSPGGLLFWIVASVGALFFVPTSYQLEVGTLLGIYVSLGALLLVSVIFRNGIERQRLDDLMQVNKDLRQANAIVEAASQRSRIVFRTLAEGVGVTDPAGNLVEVNDSLLHLAGYDWREDILGKNVAMLVDEADRSRLAQIFSFGLEMGQPAEYHMVTQDGRSYEGELAVSPLQDENGQRAGFIVVVRDITLQKQAAENFRTSEARQRQILDSVPVSILITRLSDSTILYANHTFAEQFGFSSDQLSGTTTPDLYFDADESARVLSIIRDQGGLTNSPARARRHDTGEPFWVDLSAHMIEFADEQVLLTTMVDTNARRLAEENLRARDESMRKYSLKTAELSRSSNIINGKLETALEEIDEAVSNTMKVQRVGVWFYNEDHNQLQCANLFEPGKGHIRGANWRAVDFPGFFNALLSENALVVDDAQAHPSTREFAQSLLNPLGISSMLVAPIRLRGRVTGVICCEHVGPKRHWSLEEEGFVSTTADVVTAALESQERVGLAQEIEDTYRRRGLQVQLSTEVAQEISAASGLTELFTRVVSLVKERFGYYHTQLLRYEPAQNAVVLIAGYGEVGEKMLQTHYRLPMGTGLIGTAAETGETILRTALVEDGNWQPNPLLPDTQGEIAVPIKLRGQVLGVLDVQSSQAGALTQDDQILLEGLCGQVAVAIEETRLRQEMEERLQELNSLYASMSHQGWEDVNASYMQRGYLFDRVGVVSLAGGNGESQNADALDSNPAVEEETAYTVVPMQIHGDEQIGDVSVENDPEHPLSDDELTFIDQVSEQVSLALESARLFAQTQVTLGETEDLYQASAELNAASTYDEILGAIRKSIDKGGEAHLLTIGLFDRPWTETAPAQSVNILASWSSLSQEVVSHFPQHFEVNESPMAMALRPDAPTVIEDARSDPNLDEALRSMLLNALSTQSAINAPLTVGGQWIGFLSVSFQHPRTFSEDEIRRLLALSSQAAVAINNMMLLETTQVRAQRERILREVTTRVRSSVDADTILRTAVRELGTALGREAFIRLTNPALRTDNA